MDNADIRKELIKETIEEIRAEYDITHKEIPAKKETVENSATEQKSQNAK